MNREHASNGFKVVANTVATPVHFYGITVVDELVISAVVAPTNPNPDGASAYDGDEGGLAGLTLPPGYYPIRGSSITLTSGKAILWRE